MSIETKTPKILDLAGGIELVAALGVPGLALCAAIEFSGFLGAAAITSALATLGGPFGMVGGLASLPILGYLAKQLATLGIERVAKGACLKWQRDGKSRDEIWSQVRSMRIPGRYKDYIYRLMHEDAAN